MRYNSQTISQVSAGALLANTLVHGTAGAEVNITVDDQAVDPATGQSLISYTEHFPPGQNCSECASRPDPSQAFRYTWHDVTYDPGRPDFHSIPQNATFGFDGSAIYVYGIQSQSLTLPSSNAYILFSIDGANVHNYTFQATGPADTYKFNQLLFSGAGLGQGPHTLQMQNGYVGGALSLMLLDYLVYTTDDDAAELPPSSTSSMPSSTARPTAATSASPSGHSVAAGGHAHGISGRARTTIVCVAVLVAALGLALAAALAYRTRRRRMRRSDGGTAPPGYAAQPFVLSEPVAPRAAAHSAASPKARSGSGGVVYGAAGSSSGLLSYETIVELQYPAV